jgi:CMP-N,N'-diacetyllegionaminic acid synthase
VTYLGVIPARAGSKGLPGKNLRLLAGKPMLQYTIEAALGSERLDDVVLSSEDAETIALAERLGCPAPFVRPAELATDEAGVLDVVLHALDHLGKDDGAVVLLQPTTPLRTAGDIDAAIATFEASGRESLLTVAPVQQHPWNVVRVDGDRLVWAPDRPGGEVRRQDFPPSYHVNGAVYITAVPFLRARRAFHDERSAIHVMDESHSIDVDDLHDLAAAERLLADAD